MSRYEAKDDRMGRILITPPTPLCLNCEVAYSVSSPAPPRSTTVSDSSNMSSSGIDASHEEIKSKIQSSLDGLTASSDRATSPDTAASQVISACVDYVTKLGGYGSLTTSDQPEESPDYPYRNSTPGVPHALSNLWDTVLDKVHESPTTDDAHQRHIGRVVGFVHSIKHSSYPGDQEWKLDNQKVDLKDLPLLGPSVRDVYNEPIDTMEYEPETLVSPDVQKAIACPYYSSLDDTTDDASRIGADRHRWLSLQVFLSQLWRDCGCDSYALYALWAVRAGLEDLPTTLPSCDATPDSFETSPAYLAFQVEAAAIWIRNTAPLIYKCREIWGKNGNPQWPDKAGAPGRGGARWDGVDGYDAEHKRWKLWKQILGEVAVWCDAESAKGHMKGWKVKEATAQALEAMNSAEETS